MNIVNKPTICTFYECLYNKYTWNVKIYIPACTSRNSCNSAYQDTFFPQTVCTYTIIQKFIQNMFHRPTKIVIRHSKAFYLIQQVRYSVVSKLYHIMFEIRIFKKTRLYQWKQIILIQHKYTDELFFFNGNIKFIELWNEFASN
jgi:hypothetical protein